MSGQHGRSNGFTLIETIVSVCIIGMILSFLMPAVQSARESARHASCLHNLRQLSLAFLAYESTAGVLPDACGMPNVMTLDRQTVILDLKHFSAFSRVLPHLDQEPLFNAINFEVNLQEVGLFGSDRRGLLANATALETGLSVFLCPSDSAPSTTPNAGGTNYRISLGTTLGQLWASKPTDGPMRFYAVSRLAEILDGLSNTILLGEKLRGQAGTNSINARRDVLTVYPTRAYSTSSSYLADCSNQWIVGQTYSRGGSSWLIGTMPQTCFNTVISPNGSIPDCKVSETGVNPVYGLFGARSNHPDSVNVSMSDGSVRTVKNTIHHGTWMALGTKACGERVDND